MLGLSWRQVFDDFWRDVDARENGQGNLPHAKPLLPPPGYARRHERVGPYDRYVSIE